jgi:glycosyltransferase involved in cell wall biosynthesis
VLINQRIPQSPPKIQSVLMGVPRPQWSVMIPVYNCSEYLKSTLDSVLVQDMGLDQMQIEVVDDGSTDANVEEMVKAIGKGRVSYFRQPINVGSLWNFQTCINRAKGHLIHILHGDDKVRKDFYHSMNKLFQTYPSIGAGFCCFAYINEKDKFLFDQPKEMEQTGILDHTIERLCERQKIQYASMVVRRDVYERLGSFYGVEYGEDWEMWVRIAAQYPIGYIPDVLAEYRRHSRSISGQSFLTGRNMECLEWVMHEIEKYLPEKDRKSVMLKCRKFYSHYALLVAKSLWVDQRHRDGVRAQINAARRLHIDIFLIFQIVILRLRMTVGA